MRIINAALRGMGQVWLQRHAGTGLFLLAALAVSSWSTLVGAVVGSVVGTLVALAARTSVDAVDAGLCGFNGALVGAGALTAFDLGPVTLAIVVVGAAASTGIAAITRRAWRVPAFTAPFVVVYWMILFAGDLAHLARSTGSRGVVLVAGHIPPLDAVAQVVFAAGPLAGALVIVGLGLSDRRAGLVALCGAAGAWLVVEILPLFPASDVENGGFGFNAVITAVGLAVSGRSLWVIGAGTVVALVLHAGMASAGLVAATAPFVLVMWSVHALASLRR